MIAMKLFTVLCIIGLLSCVKSEEAEEKKDIGGEEEEGKKEGGEGEEEGGDEDGKEEDLREVFSEPSRNHAKDSYIKWDRDYDFTYNLTCKITIDTISIVKQITQESEIVIIYSTYDRINKKYKTHHKEVNLCDDGAKGLDARVRNYVLKVLGVKEKKCPIEPTTEPIEQTHSDSLQIKLDFGKEVTEVELIWKLVEKKREEITVNEKKIVPAICLEIMRSASSDEGIGKKEGPTDPPGTPPPPPPSETTPSA